MAKWYSYLLRENLWGVLGQLLTFAAGIVFIWLMPNIMGVEEFGKFSIAFGLASLLLGFVDLGTSYAVLKFVSGGKGRHGTFSLLFSVRLIATAAVSCAMFLGAGAIASVYDSPFLLDGFRLGALLLAFLSLGNMLHNALIAVSRTKLSFYATVVFQILRIALPAWMWFAFGSYLGAMLGMALAYLVWFLVLLYFIVREELAPKFGIPSNIEPEVGRYMKYGTMESVGTSLIQYSDPLVIALSQGAAAVAVYKVAWSWASSFTSIFPFSYQVLISAYARESLERGGRMLARTIKYGLMLSALVVVGAFLVSKKFLILLYGQEFAGAFLVLAILSLLAVERALVTLSSPVLVGRGRIRMATLISLLGGAAQVVLMLAVTPVYGITGTAVAVVATRMVFALVAARAALETVKASLDFKSIFLTLACALATYLIFSGPVAGIHDMIYGLAAVAAISATYVILLFATGALGIWEMKDLASGMRTKA
ncbi:MAG: oligosaccharide flippase family protein [Candidatus Micrarchaeota archaeon]|nr:oligosaccharide flippase family protein [Candidatus Micrarchaeota archaeon]